MFHRNAHTDNEVTHFSRVDFYTIVRTILSPIRSAQRVLLAFAWRADCTVLRDARRRYFTFLFSRYPTRLEIWVSNARGVICTRAGVTWVHALLADGLLVMNKANLGKKRLFGLKLRYIYGRKDAIQRSYFVKFDLFTLFVR